jgi:hypothetical protein
VLGRAGRVHADRGPAGPDRRRVDACHACPVDADPRRVDADPRRVGADPRRVGADPRRADADRCRVDADWHRARAAYRGGRPDAVGGPRGAPRAAPDHRSRAGDRAPSAVRAQDPVRGREIVQRRGGGRTWGPAGWPKRPGPRRPHQQRRRRHRQRRPHQEWLRSPRMARLGPRPGGRRCPQESVPAPRRDPDPPAGLRARPPTAEHGVVPRRRLPWRSSLSRTAGRPPSQGRAGRARPSRAGSAAPNCSPPPEGGSGRPAPLIHFRWTSGGVPSRASRRGTEDASSPTALRPTLRPWWGPRPQSRRRWERR